MLPNDFLTRMQNMLGDNYDKFVESFDKENFKSLRTNDLKGGSEEFLNSSSWDLEKIPWTSNGFYYNDIKPGKHPYHEAGAYYIQEASAMLPGVLLDAKPGEKILDLCAAPGGKTTQIAASMNGEGLLICNEIIPSRAKILSENVERMGIKNAVVTNEDSEKLADKFPEFFDRIMVDAPCSGEGMFRKNNDACNEWSLANVEICADRQLMILNNAAKMLKPGGRIVYSTCTFAPLENEGTLCKFIEENPEFHLVKPDVFCNGFDSGHFDYLDAVTFPNAANINLEYAIRLWPHMINGEGHFAAILEKDGEGFETNLKYDKSLSEREIKNYRDFEKDSLNIKLDGTFVKFGDQLYVLPAQMPSLKKLKVLRPGLHLGTFLKNRFEPAHSLALSLNKEQVKNFVDVDLETARKYIGGETFACEGNKGWNLVTVDGYSIGWGKCSNNTMKNHYPKGLRKLL